MIYRIDVRTARAAGADPAGEAVRRQIAELGVDVGAIQTRRLYLIDADASREQMARAADRLLADPIVERASVIAPGETPALDPARSLIEIHLKPGVMDPVAASAEAALRDMGVAARQARTGRAFELPGRFDRAVLARIASRVLANGVIESVHFDPYFPDSFAMGREEPFVLRQAPILGLDDAGLSRLSRQGHLFLSLAEMKAVQAYFREQGREPTDIELETLAQTWSEHCVHKTLKSAVEVEERDAAGRVTGRRHYDNLIKQTIFASTVQLMSDREDVEPFCLSVFKDNAGVVVFDDVDAICFKVETHNHPSAIEPYGGSATGVGGVIRDILGTGLAARPVANTDVFCVALPDERARAAASAPGSDAGSACGAAPALALPKGVIHPKRVLQQVVAGVRDYGNRMGIPTVNGAVYFDDRYLGNPLVFCGCVGLIPRDKVAKATRAGDAVVVMGGRTGRDGIHGATFSSAELTDSHADEFSHAVQIGDAITEKKLADVILQARDRGLFSAVTDCGAGGLSSAVGEMGESVGADIELDKAPLKYAGLRYDEIWISEAQERMVLSVPPESLDALLKLAESENVEAAVIGRFGVEGRRLRLSFRGQRVGDLSMDLLHHGIPMPRRKAAVDAPGENPLALTFTAGPGSHDGPAELHRRLLAMLAHPNIASKHWIIRQYDHEVQGGSVVKPLVGPSQIGPSDAAVIRPKLSSRRGVAIGCGLAPGVTDPYAMTIAAIDEAVRNVVAVGADLHKTAILDNFCWPSVDDERTMGSLVRACEACRDAALAYRIPFISGKDSLHNQFTDSETGRVIRIPSTLLISAIAVIDDVARCVTMDLKRAGNRLYFVRAGRGKSPDNLEESGRAHRAVARALGLTRPDDGAPLVQSCHDVSDGGVLAAIAEMCIASGLGARLADGLWATIDPVGPFSEMVGGYVIEADGGADDFARTLARLGLVADEIGAVGAAGASFDLPAPAGGRATVALDALTRAWRGTLDW